MSQRRVTRDQLAIVVKLSNESKKEKSIFSYLFIRTKIILTHIAAQQPASRSNNMRMHASIILIMYA